MQRLAFLTAVWVMFCGAATLGCIEVKEPSGAKTSDGGTGGHDHGDHAHGHAHHDHGAHGPHGGHLIELGDGAYHAEWVHDNPAEQENAKNVTVYILGEDAKTEVPIEAEQITINISGGKEPRQYLLAAVNADNGKASQFALDDPALVVDLGMVGEEVKARMNLNIDGTPYNVEIEHDHHGHDHAH